jgi:hypothetical protein
MPPIAFIVLGVLVVVGLVVLVRGLSGADPRIVRRIFKWTFLVIGSAIVAYLLIMGRLVTALWVLGATLPLLMRWRAIKNITKNWRGPTPGQASDIETAYLRMRLDHDSGELDGTVLTGPFRGRQLGELAHRDLMALLQECRINDPQSASILESYLDRVHGAEWRGGEDAAGAAGAAPGGRAMSVEEAYEILGLRAGASTDEIREAHHKLMLKNHPDHGGSTYLAAKINQAKDLLLGH